MEEERSGVEHTFRMFPIISFSATHSRRFAMLCLLGKMIAGGMGCAPSRSAGQTAVDDGLP